MGHEIMVSAMPTVYLDKTVLCLLVREQMRTLLNTCGVHTYHTSRPCELQRYCPCSHGQELLTGDRQWHSGRRNNFMLETPPHHMHILLVGPSQRPSVVLLTLSGKQKRWKRHGCSLDGSAGIGGCRNSLVLVSKPNPGSWTQCKEPQTSGTLTSRL